MNCCQEWKSQPHHKQWNCSSPSLELHICNQTWGQALDWEALGEEKKKKPWELHDSLWSLGCYNEWMNEWIANLPCGSLTSESCPGPFHNEAEQSPEGEYPLKLRNREILFRVHRIAPFLFPYCLSPWPRPVTGAITPSQALGKGCKVPTLCMVTGL